MENVSGYDLQLYCLVEIDGVFYMVTFINLLSAYVNYVDWLQK